MESVDPWHVVQMDECSQGQGQGQDDDSEAEKLSPLLNAEISMEALDAHGYGMCDIHIDDEIQTTENEIDADSTCHVSH